VLRAITKRANAHILLQHEFRFHGFGSKKFYADPNNQGDQRLLYQHLFPPLHTLTGEALSIQELHHLMAVLPQSLLPVDIETRNYSTTVPLSGSIVQIGIGGETNRILTLSSLCPQDDAFDNGVVIPYDDELLGVQAAWNLVRDSSLVVWFNGDNYDGPMLHRCNRKYSEQDILAAQRKYRRGAGSELTPELRTAGEAIVRSTRETMNHLRAAHPDIKGPVWHSRRLPEFDLYQFLHRRNWSFGSHSLESVMNAHKIVTYDEQEANWETEAGRRKNTEYLMDDLDLTREAFRRYLPAILAESLVSGNALDMLPHLDQQQSMTRERMRTHLTQQGVHLYSDAGRRAVQAQHERERDVLRYFRTLTVAPQHTQFHEGTDLFYNGLILHGMRHLIAQKPSLTKAFALVADAAPEARILTLQLFENYYAAVLVEVQDTLDRALRFQPADYARAVRRFDELLPETAFALNREPTLSIDGLADKALAIAYQLNELDTYATYRELYAGKRLLSQRAQGQAAMFTVRQCVTEEARTSAYYLGSGNVLFTRHGTHSRMVAHVDDTPLLYRVFFHKADLPVRSELIAAVQHAQPPAYHTTNKVLHRLALDMHTALACQPLLL
jgi:hypothetical protein